MGWKWRKCSRPCSGLSLYNSRVIIYLLSPRHGYLKEDCAQAVAAVQICLPKDIISNDELGLSLFLQGVYTFPGRPCWTPVCFCPDCFHIGSTAFGHANMALNNTPTVV